MIIHSSFLLTRSLSHVTLAVSLFYCTNSTFAANFNTIQPGTLTVGFNGDMPGTEYNNGILGGVDGEILQKVADKLGLKIKPAMMEWSAEIAAVQAGRVDVMLGMMTWRKQRAEVMSLSNPLYYYRATIAQIANQNWCKLKDLENQTIGTITGFAWVDELKTIPGAKLKLYDTSDAAMRDLVAGRISALLADPPLVQYAVTQNPAWNVHQTAFCEGELDRYPQLTKVANIVIAANKTNGALIEAIDGELKSMWDRCEVKTVAAKYGLSQDTWFTPGKDIRAGIDRPNDWTQPSCK